MKKAKLVTKEEAEIATKTIKQRKEKPAVKLLVYTIKCTIPTGSYANVCPEITVEANSLEEAHSYLAPHIEKLHKDYFMYLDKPVEAREKIIDKKQEDALCKAFGIAPTKEAPTEDCSVDDLVDYLNNDIPAEQYMSEPYRKANNALNGCKTKEAFEMIKKQIELSTKLSPAEKALLAPLLEAKSKEING